MSNHQRGILTKGGFPYWFFLIFAGIYWLIARGVSAPSDLQNPQILKIFSQYQPYFGAGFALISLICTFLLVSILRIFGKTHRFISSPLLSIGIFGGWAGFAYQLLHFEPRYTEIAKAIISFCGSPLWIASLSLAILSIIWLIINIFKK
ncbi:MAG TPA: hypothetical protein PLQ36_02460 [Candidatus Gracilibacteria bacterium]|nr:hypothetical protein [Candidatus Gracilibacteria bacterium]